jgi:hypothetical protein
MTGGEMQKAIIDVGHTFGWRIAHFRPMQDRRGVWRTPVAADGAGFPDLVLLHPRREGVLWREIKGRYETVRPDQLAWGEALMVSGEDWAIWRPAQWEPEIVPLLTFGKGRVL